MKRPIVKIHALIALLTASTSLLLPVAGEESVSETFISYASVVNGASGGSWGLTYLSLQMVRPIAALGTITEVGAGTVTDAVATWTDNQFNPPNGSFYLSLTSGAGAGKMVDITATEAAANRVTLVSDLNGIAQPGDQYEIRPHFSISDLFGASNSVGLEPGPNPEVADNIILFAAESQAATTIFYSNVEGNTGWFKSDYTPAGGLVVYPQQGVIIRRRAVNSLTVFGTGAVKSDSTIVRVVPGYNVLGTLRAERALKLSDLNLFTGNPATGLAGGRNQKEADNLVLVDATGATRTYFYSTVPGFTGWHSSTYQAAGDLVIPAGSAFIIDRKSPRGPFEWAIPSE